MTTAQSMGGDQHPPARRRGIAAGICLALAVLLTVPAVIGFWSNRTLADEDAFVATTAPLAEDATVQQAVASQVSQAVASRLDVGDLLNAALGGLVQQATLAMLTTDTFQGLWDQANREAQQALMAQIEGRPSAVSVSGDQVVLDLAEVVKPTTEGLVAQGLAAAAGVAVPSGDLQVVLMDAGTLSALRTFQNTVGRVAGWLVYVVALLYVSAVVLAGNRPRMLVLAGLGLCVTGIIIAGLAAFGGVGFRASLSDGLFGPAAGVYYSTLTAGLSKLWIGQMALGTVLAFGGATWWIVARHAEPGTA